jgi:sulfur-carrier protein adenylyltransferase/sulfurtransferase
MSQLEELSPAQFRARWPDISNVILLDVREHDELAVASVAGAVHIPMRQIPDRLGAIDRDRAVVVMCHSGVRSRRVAEFLVANGFEAVYNLAGGIDAWSRELDPSVPRY